MATLISPRSRTRVQPQLPVATTIVVWQRKVMQPIIKLSEKDLNVFIGDFEKVAVIEFVEEKDVDDAVSIAWVWTNNIEKPWYDRVREGFSVCKRPCRSTSVGDMVQVDDKFWMLDFIGQREATILQLVARSRKR